MTGRNSRYCLAAVIAALSFAVYLPALRNDFVYWDDNVYVFENPNIRSLDWTFFKWALTDMTSVVYWHPVTWLSHAVDYALWGLNPLGHHLSSILIHSVNTFIAVCLVAGLLEGARASFRDGSGGSSLFLSERVIAITAGVSGLLFGLHPLHVESVVWIAERKDLLFSLFYMLSLMSYFRYAVARKDSTTRDSLKMLMWDGNYLLAFFFFLLALASKPMAVSLPVVLVLLEWYPLGMITSLRGIMVRIAEKIPFILCSALVSLLAVVAQKKVGAMASLADISFPVRVAVACKALVMYIWNMVMPINLQPFYPHPLEVSLLSPEYFSTAAFVFVLTAGCFFVARKRPLWLSLWGYFVITLLPALGIVQVGMHSMADRFAYLPVLGPFLAVGLGIAWLWVKADQLQKSRAAVRPALLVTAVFVAAALSYATIKQTGIWKNSMVFWNHVIAQEPYRVPVAYNNRGLTFLADGRTGEALADFTSAIALAPAYYLPYYNRGVALQASGRDDEAIDDYTTALTLNPEYAKARFKRGVALAATGQSERALDDFNAAIGLNPLFADAYISRGLMFENTLMFDRAIADYDHAITLNPASGDAYVNRGVAYERLNRPERAIEDYDRAIGMDPSDYLAYSNRGIAKGKLGLHREAISDHTKAISLKPDFAKAYLDRGGLHLKAGDFSLGLSDFRKACDLGNGRGCEELRRHEK